MLSIYDRRQACDHTNKIIKRSSKGKLCAKQRILRYKEFRGAAVSVHWPASAQSNKNGRRVWTPAWGMARVISEEEPQTTREQSNILSGYSTTDDHTRLELEETSKDI